MSTRTNTKTNTKSNLKKTNLVDVKLGGFQATKAFVVAEPARGGFRRSQRPAFDALKKHRHVILEAPTGWGKSFVIIMLCLWRMLRNRKLRCIIATSQTMIGSSFNEDREFSVPGQRNRVSWPLWLADDLTKHISNKVRRLTTFLKNPHGPIAGRVTICTHATLVKTYQRLKRQRKLHLLDHTFLWIDETHHVMNGKIATGGTRSNALGDLLRYCLSTKTVQVGLASATLSRGDMRHILTEDMATQFKHHAIPYDVYFNAMKPLKGFRLNMVCAEYQRGIEHIFKTIRPTIIYLAKRQSRYATKCKYSETQKIIARIAKLHKARSVRKGDLIHLESPFRTIKILDMVNPVGRKQRQKCLDHIKSRHDLDIVIALDTCKEGWNWIWAERSVIIGERHSITEMIQMIGRLFRKAPGKSEAEVYQLLPPLIGTTSEKFKKQRDDYLTVVLAAMLLEEVYAPLVFSGRKGARGEGRTLFSFFSETGAWDAVLRDFQLKLSNVSTFAESIPFRQALLNKHGILEADHKWVWERLWGMFAKLTRRRQGKKLNVSFEVLKNTNIQDGLLSLSSDACGTKTFAALREVLGGVIRTPEEWVPIAEQLARDYYREQLEVGKIEAG